MAMVMFLANVTGMFVLLSLHFIIIVPITVPSLVNAIAMVHITAARTIDRVGAAIRIFLGGATVTIDPTLALVTKKI